MTRRSAPMGAFAAASSSFSAGGSLAFAGASGSFSSGSSFASFANPLQQQSSRSAPSFPPAPSLVSSSSPLLETMIPGGTLDTALEEADEEEGNTRRTTATTKMKLIIPI
eukprot:CAMPEP_0177661016 /NCGR_PEP_ID=MMETSP0447-20121125/18402_1 /TAXON_ID=0 /ORGANISM="Stygamoeba regulata, Strain BSH-02190019" /LENGTH=109 /DNA_ID=CAMNT_0019166227 /DNA_START=220 /DNA_END=549 /DNA_ORIENTATION=-